MFGCKQNLSIKLLRDIRLVTLCYFLRSFIHFFGGDKKEQFTNFTQFDLSVE